MENTLSLLSYIHQVPTMTLILIFVSGVLLGIMLGSSYETYKYTKFLKTIKPKVSQLENNLRKMRELNDQYRFIELQRSIASEPFEALESEDTE
tara:strand:- start:11805 stop:12086 length:282 start_codon:yes stop_codon:yes gene_type:complete